LGKKTHIDIPRLAVWGSAQNTPTSTAEMNATAQKIATTWIGVSI
jgi:hypothetical protein